MAVHKHELNGYIYRDYDFGGRVYSIEKPVELYTADNGKTHRVVDAQGVVHIVPAPGFNGCVLRYEKAPEFPKVEF